MNRKKILVYQILPQDQMARLQSEHDVSVADPRAQPSEFLSALSSAHGLLGAGYAINAQVLDRAPNLEAISTVSVGVDHYDLAELHQRGIVLAHTPGVLNETVADTVFALLMATSRRLVELATLVREGHWTAPIGEELCGLDVYGKTLGLIGFGHIAQAIARRASLGFGMLVHYYARRSVEIRNDESGVIRKARYMPFADVLASSDFVIAMLPLTEATRKMFDATAFSLMKPGAIFINGGRGRTVDEPALLAALDSGHLRAAGLDVFATEPLPYDSPLRVHPRVTPLPHVGSSTVETRRAMAELATTNILQALAGARPAGIFDTHRNKTR